jgi:hypothetical protein
MLTPFIGGNPPFELGYVPTPSDFGGAGVQLQSGRLGHVACVENSEQSVSSSQMKQGKPQF